MSDLTAQEVDEGVVFVAKIVPGSGKTGISGLLDGMLKIKVAAAPQKQKANKCLIEFLAKELGVKKNAVNIISGKNRPIKQMQVSGVSVENLLEKLNLCK